MQANIKWPRPRPALVCTYKNNLGFKIIVYFNLPWSVVMDTLTELVYSNLTMFIKTFWFVRLTNSNTWYFHQIPSNIDMSHSRYTTRAERCWTSLPMVLSLTYATVIRCGSANIKKSGISWKGWRERWIVLKSNFLLVYKNVSRSCVSFTSILVIKIFFSGGRTPVYLQIISRFN